MSDFNWIYNTTTGFAYNLCDCENLKDCKSKPIPKVDNPKMGKINITNEINVYDLNGGLINTYNQVKNNPSELIKQLDILKKDFITIQTNTEGQRGKPEGISETTYKNSREHFYYWIRDKYNNEEKNTVKSASYFIFLNKTGFRGMYREGNNGFNIPYGLKDRKTIPSIFDEKEIKEISSLI